MRTIKEDLNLIPSSFDGPANEQATSMGLVYVGFGRYEDPSVGQITHISKNGKLVPYNRAVRTNDFQQNNTNDYGNFSEYMTPEIEQLNENLINSYPPENYNDDELNIIGQFTSGMYFDINNRLSALPPGIQSDKIEPMYSGDNTPMMVKAMDSIIKRSRAPQDFMTYTEMINTDLNNLQPGTSFVFKGYRPTTINISNVIQNSDKQEGMVGRPQIVVLQIVVKKNSRGIYTGNYSQSPDDMEFVLPRGAKINVLSGPIKLVGSDAESGNLNLEILYFNCMTKG